MNTNQLYLIKILSQFGIPYGNYNEQLTKIFPSRSEDVDKIINGSLTNIEFLDTIGFITAVTAEFYRDDELETIIGCTVKEIFEVLENIKSIYIDRF